MWWRVWLNTIHTPFAVAWNHGIQRRCVPSQHSWKSKRAHIEHTRNGQCRASGLAKQFELRQLMLESERLPRMISSWSCSMITANACN